MTFTLELPLQVEQAYVAHAKARGVPLSEVVREALMSAQPTSPAMDLTPDEWVVAFRAWVASHAENSVVLADEAMGRESIYGDHGR